MLTLSHSIFGIWSFNHHQLIASPSVQPHHLSPDRSKRPRPTAQLGNLSYLSRISLSNPSPLHQILEKSITTMSFLFSPIRRTSATISPAISRRAFSVSSPSRLARITLVGRLGTDPEVVESAKGSQVIKYVIGTNYGPRENRQTSWFRIASFAQEGSPGRDYLLGLTKG